jgi:hypothetical protein
VSKFINRSRVLVAAAAISLGFAGLSAQTASAAEYLHETKSESLMCPITTDAEVTREAYTVRGRTRYRAIVKTASVIGFNEYLFVGCRIGVNVRIMNGGEVYNTVSHEALAGAKWDPWGNKKWYTWYDEVPIEDLEDADHLQIVHEQR